MSERQFHPAAEISPMMSEQELNELADDIRVNGLQSPIELLDGKIIDGRNRYRACEIAKKTPRVVHVKAIRDPLAYVLSRNLHRRHLTTSQKAMIAARARELFEEQAKQRMLAGKKVTNPKATCPEGALTPAERQALMESEGGVEPEERIVAGQARDLAGKALGVSGRSVDRATKVLKKGSKKLIKEVDAGKLTVAEAAKALDKEATPPGDVPKDKDGVPIPEKLRPVFAAVEDFEQIAAKLSTAKSTLVGAEAEFPEAFDHGMVQRWTKDIVGLRFAICEAQPYLVCPRCQGGNPDCGRCDGDGWLSRQDARNEPIEERNKQRAAAGLKPLRPGNQKIKDV